MIDTSDYGRSYDEYNNEGGLKVRAPLTKNLGLDMLRYFGK